MNRVFLMGRICADPELRRVSSGEAVTDLRIATSRKYTTKGGEEREDTLYIDVTVWGRQAETACQYLRKGSGVHVEGSLKTESWDDKKTGEKRSKVKVQADRVQFLDGRGSGEGGGQRPGGSGGGRRDQAPRGGRSSAPQGTYDGGEDDEDSIPF